MISIRRDTPPARKSRSKMKALLRKDTVIVEGPSPATGANIEGFTSAKMSSRAESRERIPLCKNPESTGPAENAKRSTMKETAKQRTRPPSGTYHWKFWPSSTGIAAPIKEIKESILSSPSWKPWIHLEELDSIIQEVQSQECIGPSSSQSEWSFHP